MAAAYAAGAAGGVAIAVGPNLLTNPGFESGLTGWTSAGTAGSAYVQTANAHTGARNLAHHLVGTWSADTVQIVRGLTRGTYTLSAWIKNWGVTSAGLEAYSCGDATQSVAVPNSTEWRQVTLVVSVLSSTCTVGVWSTSGTSSMVADDFEFSRTTAGSGGAMPAGGDVTYRRMTAAMGGRWADASGTQRDVLDILAAKGFNLARIRIYNQPGNPVDDAGTTYRLQAGWQDLADAVQNAEDAKARGMKIFISLHYSDFWTNPGLQLRPNAWSVFSQKELEAAVYNFTRTVMTTMQSNGITPDFLSIGNEINNAVAGVDRASNPAGYYGVLRQGAAAVRSVSSTTKVVIHLTEPEQSTYANWIAGATEYGLDYDVMGISLYPFWTNLSIASMANFASGVSSTSGRPVMVCEVGYPWTLSPQDTGQQTLIKQNGLDPDGPENYGATPSGQLRYLQEYLRAMYSTGVVVGVSYWDPIWLDLRDGADPNGWVVGGDNSVEDTTLFDYGDPHVAQAGLGAFNSW